MSVAVQQQMMSGREEELGEIFRTMLEWNNYAAAVNGPHATVQQLRDLITNSVTMETGGEPLISALCTISSSTDDVIVSFDRLVHFVQHDPDPPKTELSQRLLYPLFVHCYLFLIASDDADKAHKLYRHFADTVASKGSPEVRELEQISSLEDLTQSSLAEKFRSHKYFVRMSHSSFVLLITFLQTNQTPVLINIIQKYIQIEVFGNSTQSNGENKTESKRSTFPLMKPRIGLFGIPPKKPAVMYMTPAMPPALRDPSPAKAEFKERLSNTVSQLDPTAPSLLVYTVSSPSNTAHCTSWCTQSMVYAAGLHDSSISLWSSSGRTTNDHTHSPAPVLKGHHGPVYGVSFTSSGQHLLSASEDTTVRLWDVSSGKSLVCYSGHGYPVWDVAFSPVDGYFVSSSYDRTARFWSSEYVYPLRILVGHEASVDVARIHPNGSYIATGSSDHTCRLWDINNGACVRVFTGSKASISSLGFATMGRRLASGGEDGTIHLWDLGSAKLIHELKGHTGPVTALAYSSDGTLLASAAHDNTIKLWNMKAILTTQTSLPPSKELILSQQTGTSLILSMQFTHRNSLVAIATTTETTPSQQPTPVARVDTDSSSTSSFSSLSSQQ